MTAAAASVGRGRRAPDPQAVAVRAGALSQGAPSPRLLRHRHRAPSRALPAPRPATPHLAAPRERPVLSVFRVRKPGLSLMQFPQGCLAAGRYGQQQEAGGQRPRRQQLTAGDVCKRSGLTVRESRATSVASRELLFFQNVLEECTQSFFFFFLLKKHAQQSKVCGEID